MNKADSIGVAKASREGLYAPDFEHDACGVGFVVDVKGRKSHRIVEQGIEVLVNLEHRGACGCEPNTGDGAGILIQMPDLFLRKVCDAEGIRLPGPFQYGAGIFFFPRDPGQRAECERIVERIVAEEGQQFLGWRTVPTDGSSLGASARRDEPFVRHAFVAHGPGIRDDAHFERKLYVIRRRAEKEIRYGRRVAGGEHFYVPSLSYKTMVYKGMLKSDQVVPFYPELRDPDLQSALSVVHSRFSTNTFPSWNRAHPYRCLCHNGEINTLRGNVNWMYARQGMFASETFGADLPKLLPILQDDGSDSAIFDNCLEFLTLSGRPIAQAVMMMIPEPWSNHEGMSEERKAFYRYHGCLMEPWDGPASMVFTDGFQVGAILDRNGLRPSRYYVTKDDQVIMASEVGVLDIPPERVARKGRLQPGRMFFIDTREGRIVADEEIKRTFEAERPYALWLKENLVKLDDLPEGPAPPEPDHETLLVRQLAFGYTYEDQRVILAPMARNGIEPVGSMGNDAPLAVLSERPHLLYNYFKQLFAQVTNPPIDAIREEIITATETTLGSEGNLLDPGPRNCRMIELKCPVISNEELSKLRSVSDPDFRSATLPILFDPGMDGDGLEAAIAVLCREADARIAEGVTLLILSDRGVCREKAPIPALLAVSSLHHHLIRNGTRARVGLILESGEPREVHHIALLVGYGCGAINPYLAFETVDGMIREGLFIGDLDHKTAVKNYIKACVKGVVKTMSKMGISTIQSYRGAQIFEAVGIASKVVEKYFTWTPSRIEGIDMGVIAAEVRMRHERAYPPRGGHEQVLDAGGVYQWRQGGEQHLFNPHTIHTLQSACRSGSYAAFKEYSQAIDDQSRRLYTLRGMFDLRFAEKPIPIEEVESVESIMKRFKTGAMSYGSISQEAHETLAIAMNRIGGRSNTGEGGEDPERYVPLPNGDSKNSAIKQVASGRFGVTSHYLVNARELQIKMAQGAKPGEGGQLPGAKVYPWIAKTRLSTPGVGLISPPPHHDIYSIEDLAELIHDLKNSNRDARINVKLVSEIGVGTIAAGVAKAHADVVLISGYDGGTGASPLSSIQHAGVPWELGLAETHQTLVLNDLRSRIVVETDGQLKTGRDIVVAALLGAEEFGFATAPLVVMGCIMMRACHLNTCPVGVATQDPRLRAKFRGDPAHVVNFMRFLATEMRELMARLGFRTINEMVGRTDRLDTRRAIDHWKARGVDFSRILHRPDVPDSVGRHCRDVQDHGIDRSLDVRELLGRCAPAIERGERVEAELPIRNTNRVVGTIVGSVVTKRWGAGGLPDGTIRLRFRGSAGQSFGAFVPKGMTLILEGDANDYVGKGLSGGRIVVFPPRESTFNPDENIIVGNVAFYGATGGEAYVRGMAGERFCVRNSGVHAVIEAVGDHGCEYMTGGRVVILGQTGRNFAAGMSGGIAYVLDVTGDFPARVNREMVGLEALENEREIGEVRAMIESHVRHTGSARGKYVLDLWADLLPKFVKVMPKDFKRVIEALERVRQSGLSGDEAVMAAFEANAKDLARVGGN